MSGAQLMSNLFLYAGGTVFALTFICIAPTAINLAIRRMRQPVEHH